MTPREESCSGPHRDAFFGPESGSSQSCPPLTSPPAHHFAHDGSEIAEIAGMGENGGEPGQEKSTIELYFYYAMRHVVQHTSYTNQKRCCLFLVVYFINY